MSSYRVVFTSGFEDDLAQIERDVFKFGARQTEQYVTDIIEQCYLLDEMPTRFEQKQVGEFEYRAFPFKGHRIYYQVREQDVIIVAALHHRQLPEKHL